MIAYGEASTLSLDAYIFATGKEEEVKAENNYDAKNEIVNYMIAKGYL